MASLGFCKFYVKNGVPPGHFFGGHFYGTFSVPPGRMACMTMSTDVPLSQNIRQAQNICQVPVLADEYFRTPRTTVRHNINQADTVKFVINLKIVKKL